MEEHSAFKRIPEFIIFTGPIDHYFSEQSVGNLKPTYHKYMEGVPNTELHIRNISIT